MLQSDPFLSETLGYTAFEELVLPSKQAYIQAGALAGLESNGTVYLKIPLNVLGTPDWHLDSIGVPNDFTTTPMPGKEICE